MPVKNKYALEAYQKKLKAYRREYPNIPFHQAQKNVSAAMHSGSVGKKKTVKPKAKVSGKKSVGKRSVIVVEPVRKSSVKKHHDGYITRALKIQGIIDKLELTRSQQKTKQMKDIVQRAINLNHEKLRKIDAEMRSRRA